jgi:multiple sugar transport system ATP-binding protein
MGRAIVRQPQVFLMDEPLSNLDAQLRVQTRTQIAALQRRLGVTTVYVTHDQVEAMTMGDRVAVLDQGVLQQCATPKDLFTDPVNRFVAGFIGSPQMNLLEATVNDDGGATHGSMTIPLTPQQRGALTGSTVTLGVRPEDWRLESAGGLEIQVAVVEELGSEAFIYGTDPSADAITGKPIVARAEGLSATKAGDRVHLVPRADRVHVFDTGTGARV